MGSKFPRRTHHSQLLSTNLATHQISIRGPSGPWSGSSRTTHPFHYQYAHPIFPYTSFCIFTRPLSHLVQKIKKPTFDLKVQLTLVNEQLNTHIITLIKTFAGSKREVGPIFGNIQIKLINLKQMLRRLFLSRVDAFPRTLLFVTRPSCCKSAPL